MCATEVGDRRQVGGRRRCSPGRAAPGRGSGRCRQGRRQAPGVLQDGLVRLPGQLRVRLGSATLTSTMNRSMTGSSGSIEAQGARNEDSRVVWHATRLEAAAPRRRRSRPGQRLAAGEGHAAAGHLVEDRVRPSSSTTSSTVQVPAVEGQRVARAGVDALTAQVAGAWLISIPSGPSAEGPLRADLLAGRRSGRTGSRSARARCAARALPGSGTTGSEAGSPSGRRWCGSLARRGPRTAGGRRSVPPVVTSPRSWSGQ